MGVSKEVDMEFTRQHGICWLQVMVMNPNLIPHSVNIVIGEALYELKSKVEMNGELGAPQPMDMDINHDGGGSGERENGGDDRGDNQSGKVFKDGHGGAASTGRGSGHGGASQVSKKSLPLFHIELPPGIEQEDLIAGSAGASAAVFGGQVGAGQVRQKPGWRIIWVPVRVLVRKILGSLNVQWAIRRKGRWKMCPWGRIHPRQILWILPSWRWR
jgi:hypothetical protein